MFTELLLIRDYNFYDIAKSSYFHKVDNICIPSGKLIEFNDYAINRAALIDFPYGLGTQKLREHEIIEAARSQANYIDLTINSDDILNGNFDKIHHDFSLAKKILKPYHILPRVIIEYRLFASSVWTHIGTQLYQNGCEFVITSTGTIVDEFVDNLIVAERIQSTGLKVIISTHSATTNHLKMLEKAKIYGIRLPSMKAIENLYCMSLNGV